ncbi:MAG TPA: anaerobic ribonucleoside triphosphate reductase, partial [Firmicutes bacterium]|nr:anaerobic ribonucleoside triphosphate reductase [Bacillota bacterium]
KAHAEGDIHIHDKDFYLLTETCCQIDLHKLFKTGFSTGHGFLREPQSIESYAALACIALQSNQNEMHGGQSIPNLENVMADGVQKTCRKHIRDLVETDGVISGEGGLSEEDKDLL